MNDRNRRQTIGFYLDRRSESPLAVVEDLWTRVSFEASVDTDDCWWLVVVVVVEGMYCGRVEMVHLGQAVDYRLVGRLVYAAAVGSLVFDSEIFPRVGEI